MDRGSSNLFLSWLLLPATAVLAASALSLPLQPYTGLTLRGSEVMAVAPAGPGERAGIARRDLVRGPQATRDAVHGPLVEALPGAPLQLERQRDGQWTPVRVLTEGLPPGERRMMVLLIAVASVFLLVGSWVWSERRDPLTLPFLLLCLAFSTLLAPHPRSPWPSARLAHEVLYTLATLMLPALCVHFFAQFPEPREGRRLGAGLRAAYGVAGLLAGASLLTLALAASGVAVPMPWVTLIQAAAAIWFAVGLLAAVALFARSYRDAHSDDARRRLRVALLGTALGLGPLAALIVLRNLLPDRPIPGERWAVGLTLLVPLSFAWAIAVHRLFEFRVALRAAVIAASLLIAGGAMFLAGEVATRLRPDLGVDFGAVALAVLCVLAAIAGPVRPMLGWLARELHPGGDERSLVERLSAGVADRGLSSRALLEHSAAILASALRLERCVVVEFTPDAPTPLPLSASLAPALTGRGGPVAVSDPALAPADHETLAAAGIHWILPVGPDRPVAALLLGQRMAGGWLDRGETQALERCARHLAVTLENVALRDAARNHGAIDRELKEAGAIQARLLPRRAPVFPTMDCAAATLSCEAVGGDYYDFVQRGTRAFSLVVGDAAGHGVPAALLLAGVQARFQTEAMRDLEPGRLLAALNLELAEHDHPHNFVGVLCARVDVERGEVHVANGGLEPPLIRRRSGAWEQVTVGGMLLGVRADATYPDERVPLHAGDVLVFHTDGLTEARRGDTLFGADRVRDIVAASAHRRAREIVGALVEAAQAFADGPMDDLTVVVLKQLADPPGRSPVARLTLSSRFLRPVPIPRGETAEVVSHARAANPRASDPNG